MLKGLFHKQILIVFLLACLESIDIICYVVFAMIENGVVTFYKTSTESCNELLR